MNFLSRIIIIILIIVFYDLSYINYLWGERFERRLIHHFSINYFNINKNPLIYPLKNILTKTQCNYIANLELPIKYFKVNKNLLFQVGHIFSTQYSIIKPMYYNNFNDSLKEKLDKIGNSLIPLFNRVTGEKLSLSDKNFRSCILIYRGRNSNFSFHYDTEPSSYYRALILIKKEGITPKFCYLGKK